MADAPDQFQGAELEGKRFPFVRVTVSRQAKILKRFTSTARSMFLDKFFPSGYNARMWRRVRSVAFERGWMWKYLHIIPKELRCSRVSLKLAGEIQASFFSYVQGEVTGHDAPLLSAMGSKMESDPRKSAD